MSEQERKLDDGDTQSLNLKEFWAEDDRSITQFVAENTPDIVEPLVVPVVNTVEFGLKKAINTTKEGLITTKEVGWAVIKAFLLGEQD